MEDYLAKVTLKFKDGSTTDVILEPYVALGWQDDRKIRKNLEKFADIVEIKKVRR